MEWADEKRLGETCELALKYAKNYDVESLRTSLGLLHDVCERASELSDGDHTNYYYEWARRAQLAVSTLHWCLKEGKNILDAYRVARYYWPAI